MPSTPQAPADVQRLADCLRLGLHKLAFDTAESFPHALYLCRHGREVLVDADHRPLWQRLPDGTVEAADPDEWIDDIVRTTILFDDKAAPYRDYRAMKMLNALLHRWGLMRGPQPAEPHLPPPRPRPRHRVRPGADPRLIVHNALDEEGNRALAFELPDGRLASTVEDANALLNGEELEDDDDD